MPKVNIRSDKRSGYWIAYFRYPAGGKQFEKNLRLTSENKAEEIRVRMDFALQQLLTGNVILNPDENPIEYIKTCGQRRKVLTYDDKPKFTVYDVCEKFVAATSVRKASTTNRQEKSHLEHFYDVLGKNINFPTLSLDDFQEYVNKRRRQKYRGHNPKDKTIRRELETFLQVWIFAKDNKIVDVSCPFLNEHGKWIIQLEKPDDSERFRTYDEIIALLKLAKLPQKRRLEIWRGLYLDKEQLFEVLDHIRIHQLHPFIYPAAAMAGLGAMRRSEICRSMLEDINFTDNTIIVREKKRHARTMKSSTRVLNMPVSLSNILYVYIKEQHAGGPFTIALPLKTPHRRVYEDFEQVTVNSLNFHLRFTMLRSTKWKYVRWHTFRHSFGSILKDKGVSREEVAKLMGHSVNSQEMHKLYQHTYPQSLKNAVKYLD
jgi:integrase